MTGWRSTSSGTIGECSANSRLIMRVTMADVFEIAITIGWSTKPQKFRLQQTKNDSQQFVINWAI